MREKSFSERMERLQKIREEILLIKQNPESSEYDKFQKLLKLEEELLLIQKANTNRVNKKDTNQGFNFGFYLN